MAKKSKNGKAKKEEAADDSLWIAPRYSLKGANGERAWENRPGGPPHSGRLLELADIALGAKKATPFKKRKMAASARQSGKSEPYSSLK
jgi:hypothetical protein